MNDSDRKRGTKMSDRESTRAVRKRKAKINSIHFGGQWIMAGVIVGGVLPALIYLAAGVFLWQLCVAGGVILAAFFAVFAVEMRQDNGKVPYYEKYLKDTIPYDEKTQYAVVKSSICTGESVAGFRSYDNSHFTEVMLIRDPQDLERFKKIYGLTEVKKEY